jgi:hypothetical protein
MVLNEDNFKCDHSYVYQKLGPEWTSAHVGTMHDGRCVDKKHNCPIVAMMDSNARN